MRRSSMKGSATRHAVGGDAAMVAMLSVTVVIEIVMMMMMMMMMMMTVVMTVVSHPPTNALSQSP